MPHVTKTPEAEADLIEIGLYIEDDNPAAADRFLDKLDQKMLLLAEFPGMGARRDELSPGLRSLPVGNYLIFYEPTAQGIDVIRVLHGARNLRRLFRRA